MRTTRSGVHGIRTIAVLAVAGLLVTGCGRMAERVMEMGLEATTGADDISIDDDTGTITIESEDGNLTIEGDEDGGELRMETDDGESTFSAAPTTEVPPQIAALGVLPDRFVPEAIYEHTTAEGELGVVLSGTIGGTLSDTLDELEDRLRGAGHEPQRFLMDQGGEGMGSLTIELPDDGGVLQLNLVSETEQMMLQVTLLQPQS